ncbi:acyl-CoA dehydrogenase family protein [Novosphingobium piscinae]|uniref:Acyl-CoA/acyl-ACP dehydrogenase n=1 Tax=Novosphingobium piscinae TaxID=1507448 RepID=A0A7X1KRC0_9SPHN|nr:acyl-CoA dehydrogenase family protein [Novosphingobium piscinae]MBC2670587.1 acyl-CoA/acyl-ACP dehydrogenase [Novosphingobium piscinae]
MNFAFNEEQKSLGETVDRLLEDHAALRAPDLSAEANGPAWDALAELGLFAMMVPEDQGGAGLTAVDLALSVEAMGSALGPIAALDALAVTDLLVRHGTPAQQADLLPRIATGELRVAVAVTEQGCDEAPEGVGTTVTGNRLSGTKVLVREAAAAHLFAVVAQSGTGAAIYLVPADAAGVTVRAHEDIDPTCALGEVTFDNVELGAEALVGAANPARAVTRLFDGGAALSACLQVGIAARMLATAVEYARTRVQFGQAIGAFQAIKHRCADMAVAVEAARSATYYGVWAFAEDAPDRARAVSMAKAYAGEVAKHVCNETIQVHGGMGFTWELGLHRYLRRAKVIEHAFGSTLWHNERIVVETLRMDEACSGDKLAAA